MPIPDPVVAREPAPPLEDVVENRAGAGGGGSIARPDGGRQGGREASRRLAERHEAIDATARLVLARSGIDATRWLMARLVPLLAASPDPGIEGVGGEPDLRPATILRAVDALRSSSPKPGAVADRACALVREATGLACERSVQGGEATIVVRVALEVAVGAETVLDPLLRVSILLPTDADAALRDGAGDADAVALVALTAVLDQARATLAEAASAFAPDVAAYLATLEPEHVAPFARRLREEIQALDPWSPFRRDPGRRLARHLAACFDRVLTVHAASLAASRFKRSVGLHDYVNMHATARSLGRRLTLIVGPTNSGKTWEALRVATAAATSRVLSPLRLLAMEHYESLLAAGLEAAMVTGEELVGPADAPHVAQTIETLDTRSVVDVAVIDEVQMLLDPQRGWAWSEAVVGVPARHVVMTGSLDVVELVGRIAAMTGEPLEVRRLARKNPLRVEPMPLRLADVARGDAVVAFSRAAVFDLRAELIARGLSVASIYGALSPEVRRAESRRFREGEADVLVATDAIGMGLNIGTLRRVVFSTLRKYDGVGQRDLTPAEIRQIAGRAGRFGFAEAGFAGVLRGGSRVVSQALEGRARQLSAPRLLVKPSHAVVRAMAREHPGDDVVGVLGRIVAHLAGDAQVELVDLAETLEVADLVRASGLSVELCWTYACAPVDRRSQLARRLVHAWSRDHARGRSILLPESGAGELLDLEDYGRVAVLYLWLSRRFPETYVGVEAARAYRAANDRRIEAELAAGAVAKSSIAKSAVAKSSIAKSAVAKSAIAKSAVAKVRREAGPRGGRRRDRRGSKPG